ncbi:MAG: 30S ribosomal protein S9, partial [Thermoplasmata archaeon]|nr:30S ribosomal protein S9 [Thermoplasmata archaeon]
IGDAWKKYNIKVKTKGGGIIGQAQAARQAISRGLVQVLGEDVKKVFLGYDRKMLVYDPRRTEPHKPPRSSQGPRRYKQKSKR